MRERKTIDRNAMRAKHFLKRAVEATDSQTRLICLYDCFVCLNGPFSACEVAADAAGLDVTTFRSLVNQCIGDGDCDAKAQVSGYDLDAICTTLAAKLQTLLSSSSN